MVYFVNIALKLELPINVRRYFDSSKARDEGNFVIFLNREILLVPEDARICFTVLTTTRDFSEIQSCILLIMIIYVILVFILIF